VEFIYWLNPEHLLQWLIAWLPTIPMWSLMVILFAIVFAESGLFFGFFLPGDSLLFSAGLLVSQSKLSIGLWELLIVLFVAAVSGDSVGYWFGQKFGRPFFSREGSLVRDPHHLQKAEQFYAKHGKKTIILARFVPIVRTFAPIAAGISSMHYRTFISYNIIGALIWSVGITLAGFWLGKVIPDVDRYLLPIIGLIIVLSIAQPLIHFWQDEQQRKALAKKVRTGFRRTSAESDAA
jgi:membrane-associated protein